MNILNLFNRIVNIFLLPERYSIAEIILILFSQRILFKKDIRMKVTWFSTFSKQMILWRNYNVRSCSLLTYFHLMDRKLKCEGTTLRSKWLYLTFRAVSSKSIIQAHHNLSWFQHWEFEKRLWAQNSLSLIQLMLYARVLLSFFSFSRTLTLFGRMQNGILIKYAKRLLLFGN